MNDDMGCRFTGDRCSCWIAQLRDAEVSLFCLFEMLWHSTVVSMLVPATQRSALKTEIPL